MQTRTKVKIAGAVLVGTLVIVGFVGGCASTTLPPRITQAQRDALQTTHLDLSVGVEDCVPPIYAANLIQELQRTHLFTHVDRLTNFATPPDLVARVKDRIYGSSVIPIFTGLSLGVIPTTVTERHGYSFSLTRPGAGARRVRIQFVYEGPTTLGWWALVLNLLPDRTMRDVDQHPQFIEAFAWTIVSQREALESPKAP